MNQLNRVTHLVLGPLSSTQRDSLKSVSEDEIHFISNSDSIGFENQKNVMLTPVDETLKKEVNFSIIEELKAFSTFEHEGKSMNDWLTVDGMQLWYYQRFKIYFSVRNSFYSIRHIESLIGSNNSLVVYGWNSQIRAYFDGNNNVQFDDNGLTKAKAGINYGAIFKYLFQKNMRSFSSMFRINKVMKREHLVLTNHRQYPHLEHKKVSQNDFLGSLLNRTDRDDLGIIDMYPVPKLKGEIVQPPLKNLLHKEHYPKIGSEYILFHYSVSNIFQWNSLRKRRKEIKQLSKSIGALSNPIHTLFLNEFKNSQMSNFIYYVEFKAFQRFFKRSKVKSVTTIDENSPSTKLVLDAAKSSGIKTIGIQHGAIHELHPAYMYSKQEVEFSPIPDYTLVWGDYYQRLITTQGNFTTESVVTIGQPKSDLIFHKSVNREQFGSMLGSDYKNLIVFASQPQRDENLRRRAIEDVLTSTQIDDTLLVVKIHPNEHKEYYQKIIDASNYRAIVIKHEIDLYELLKVSDCLITCFSTVGAEAVFLNVPLIILDHLKQDIQSYCKEGVAIQATNGEELRTSVEQLLTGKIQINKEKYDRFQNHYALPYDGKVGDRFFKFLGDTL